MNVNRFFLLGFVLFQCMHAFGQLSDLNYKIYATKTGREISLQELAADAKNYDVVIFGEEHNDSVAHYLQIKLLELLYDKYPQRLALSLEMFDRDVQPVMNEYLMGSIREKNFTKDARVWSNYRDYKPMIEFAKAKKLDVICANAPSRYTNLAGRKGQKALMDLPEVSKKNFAPLPYDTASGKYYEKLINLTAHSPAPTTVADTTKKDTAVKMPIPAMNMGGFNLIMGQSLWDATMAYSIFKYLKKNKEKFVMHVNGRFHSDEHFAVVTQLKKYNSKLKPLVISAGPDDSFPNMDWSSLKYLGDYVIITDPKVPRTYEE
ncbi:MAG: ChaN family lipoprotein [Saprospiraceae bacterium]|nr:ChaN family lipoprotein [Saprospiraceae bacterium]